MFFILTLIAVIWGGIAGPTVIFTAYFLFVFEKALGLAPDTARFVASMMICLSIPMAAYVAGMILDRFSHVQVKTKSFGLLAMVMAFAVALNQSSVFMYLEILFQGVGRHQGLAPMALLTFRVAGDVFQNAAIIAFVLMTASLLVELPIYWISNAAGFGDIFKNSLASLRAVAIITLFGISYNLLFSFIAAEFWPLELMK